MRFTFDLNKVASLMYADLLHHQKIEKLEGAQTEEGYPAWINQIWKDGILSELELVIDEQP